MIKSENGTTPPLEEAPHWPMHDRDRQLGPELDPELTYDWPKDEPAPTQQEASPTPGAGAGEKTFTPDTGLQSVAMKSETTAGPQGEVLKPLDPAFIEAVVEQTKTLHEIGDKAIAPLTSRLKATREPENGWWHYKEAWRLGAADLKSDHSNGQENFLEMAKDEALAKKADERDAFDNFLLGSRTTHPKDMASPDPSKSVVEYYNVTDDRLLEAFDKGVLPAEFTDRAVLEKTINALIRRSVNYFVNSGNELDDLPVQKAAKLLEKASLSVPGFNAENAGARMLYHSMLICRAVLDAESPNRTFVRGSMYEGKIDQVANTVAIARYAAEQALSAGPARVLYAYRKSAANN